MTNRMNDDNRLSMRYLVKPDSAGNLRFVEPLIKIHQRFISEQNDSLFDDMYRTWKPFRRPALFFSYEIQEKEQLGRL